MLTAPEITETTPPPPPTATHAAFGANRGAREGLHLRVAFRQDGAILQLVGCPVCVLLREGASCDPAEIPSELDDAADGLALTEDGDAVDDTDDTEEEDEPPTIGRGFTEEGLTSARSHVSPLPSAAVSMRARASCVHRAVVAVRACRRARCVGLNATRAARNGAP